MNNKIEERMSEAALQVCEENYNYIERAVDSIYKHFEATGKTWGFKEEKITRQMIKDTIYDLVDTILESDEKMDCDEAGTGGIIVRVEQLNDEEYDFTILLEF